MNRITIIGNLTRDPETGTTDGGINWCRFSVAVNSTEKSTFAVNAFQTLFPNTSKHRRSSKKRCLSGRFTVRRITVKSEAIPLFPHLSPAGTE